MLLTVQKSKEQKLRWLNLPKKDILLCNNMHTIKRANFTTVQILEYKQKIYFYHLKNYSLFAHILTMSIHTSNSLNSFFQLEAPQQETLFFQQDNSTHPLQCQLRNVSDPRENIKNVQLNLADEQFIQQCLSEQKNFQPSENRLPHSAERELKKMDQESPIHNISSPQLHQTGSTKDNGGVQDTGSKKKDPKNYLHSCFLVAFGNKGQDKKVFLDYSKDGQSIEKFVYKKCQQKNYCSVYLNYLCQVSSFEQRLTSAGRGTDYQAFCQPLRGDGTQNNRVLHKNCYQVLFKWKSIFQIYLTGYEWRNILSVVVLIEGLIQAFQFRLSKNKNLEISLIQLLQKAELVAKEYPKYQTIYKYFKEKWEEILKNDHINGLSQSEVMRTIQVLKEIRSQLLEKNQNEMPESCHYVEPISEQDLFCYEISNFWKIKKFEAGQNQAQQESVSDFFTNMSEMVKIFGSFLLIFQSANHGRYSIDRSKKFVVESQKYQYLVIKDSERKAKEWPKKRKSVIDEKTGKTKQIKKERRPSEKKVGKQVQKKKNQ